MGEVMDRIKESLVAYWFLACFFFFFGLGDPVDGCPTEIGDLGGGAHLWSK